MLRLGLSVLEYNGTTSGSRSQKFRTILSREASEAVQVLELLEVGRLLSLEFGVLEHDGTRGGSRSHKYCTIFSREASEADPGS